MLNVKNLTEADAEAVCEWKYAPPYDVYNFSGWELAKREHWDIADARQREKNFRAVYAEGKLVGFFRLNEKDGFVDAGFGLRPDCCGRGLGRQLVAAVIAEAQRRFPDLLLRLDVRQFNIRAVRCYEQAGFRKIGTFRRRTPAGEFDFFLMEYVPE